MTTVKGQAHVTFIIPFQYEIDDQEFEEWAGKPVSEATEGDLVPFMEASGEPWEHNADWPAKVGWWENEIWDVEIDWLERKP